MIGSYPKTAIVVEGHSESGSSGVTRGELSRDGEEKLASSWPQILGRGSPTPVPITLLRSSIFRLCEIFHK